MLYPDNPSLPFFAYGAFRRGELAFLRIKPYVQTIDENAQAQGSLKVRDGLMLFVPGHGQEVHGHLMSFDPSKCGTAYAAISELEPERQYMWEVTTIRSGDAERQANVLVGKDADKGCSEPDGHLRNQDDPFFKEALTVVEETAKEARGFKKVGGNQTDLTGFMKLQMAYMLLWSSIERYVTLRYSLGDKVTSKVMRLAKEPAFLDELSKVQRKDTVYATNEPSSNGAQKTLNRLKAAKSVEYYYQVRCNITHRGKAANADIERLQNCLDELLPMFRACLDAAFRESAKPLP